MFSLIINLTTKRQSQNINHFQVTGNFKKPFQLIISIKTCHCCPHRFSKSYARSFIYFNIVYKYKTTKTKSVIPTFTVGSQIPFLIQCSLGSTPSIKLANLLLHRHSSFICTHLNSISIDHFTINLHAFFRCSSECSNHVNKIFYHGWCNI